MKKYQVRAYGGTVSVEAEYVKIMDGSLHFIRGTDVVAYFANGTFTSYCLVESQPVIK